MVNKAPFRILANMAARAVSLKVCYYYEALLWLLDVNKRWQRVNDLCA